VLFDRPGTGPDFGLVEAADLVPVYQPLPQFPAIVRDLAIVVDEAVTWAEIRKAIEEAKVQDLVAIDALDVYRGKQVPQGKKSVALRLTLRGEKETLTRDQADASTAQALRALESALGAVLRS
jgi:phenylalanyl-tRNA synthetase beta chain